MININQYELNTKLKIRIKNCENGKEKLYDFVFPFGNLLSKYRNTPGSKHALFLTSQMQRISTYFARKITRFLQYGELLLHF